MSQFERAERPERQTTVYLISDSEGHTAALTPAEAYDLLEWLYQQRAELHLLAHPELAERSTPVWLRDLPAWAKQTPEEQEPGQQIDPSLYHNARERS